jgi:hypothetical protein
LVHTALACAAVAAAICVAVRVQGSILATAIDTSSLPAIRIADEAGRIPDATAYRGRYEFTKDWFTWNIPVWQAVMSPYRGRPGV